MNRSNLLLSLSAALLLVSCTGGNSASEISSSEKSSSEDKQIAFNAILDDLQENNNYTLVSYFSDSGKETVYQQIEQFCDEAVYYSSPDHRFEPSGYILNGNQGVFSFTLDETVKVGEFTGYGSISDYVYSASDIAVKSLWSKASIAEGHDFRTSDDDLCLAGAYLTVAGAYFDRYGLEYFSVGSIYADLTEDGLELSQVIYYQDEEFCLTRTLISNVGVTSNDAVANYLDNPSIIRARTGWTASDLETINSFFGEDKAKELPFPAGATYAMRVVPNYDYECVSITDLASGDVSANYTRKLQNAGWDVDGEAGIATLNEATTDHLYTWQIEYYFVSVEEMIQTFMEYYQMSSAEATAYVNKYYPNGTFEIDAYFVSALAPLENATVAEVEAWVTNATKIAYPATEWTNVTSASAFDNTANNFLNQFYKPYYGIYYYSFDAMAVYHIESEADCKSNCLNYVTILENAGFSVEDYTTPEDGQWFYMAPDQKSEIMIVINYSNDDAYLGTVTIDYLVFNPELA